MRVVVVTCTCLFMVNLAVFQKSNSCIEKSTCRRFSDFSLTIDSMENHNYRILIYSHHFKALNNTEKICLLKKIMRFYENMMSTAYTKRVPKEKISALEDHLKQFSTTCLKCGKCKTIAKEKLLKCDKYRSSMALNQTQIMHCQEILLKKAKRKSKKHPTQVQEKAIYELYILIQFVDQAANFSVT